MSTRIMRGYLKRRMLQVPRIVGVRPTRAMVRKAIFDVLGEEPADVEVLDLFSGSGALGFEAISAGARQVTFVEKNPACSALLRHNAAALGIAERCRVIKRDVFKVLPFLAHKGWRFGLILADPPYTGELAKKCLLAVSNCDIVSAPAIVVIEHRKSDLLPDQSNSLTRWQCKRYGDTSVSFYIPN